MSVISGQKDEPAVAGTLDAWNLRRLCPTSRDNLILLSQANRYKLIVLLSPETFRHQDLSACVIQCCDETICATQRRSVRPNRRACAASDSEVSFTVLGD